MGILQAEIKQNEWIVYKASEFWDIEYSPGHLRINKGNRNIFVELHVRENNIELRAELFYKGKIIIITPNKIKNSNIKLSSNIISDCHTGIKITDKNVRRNTEKR
jgi:hypothetical protein